MEGTRKAHVRIGIRPGTAPVSRCQGMRFAAPRAIPSSPGDGASSGLIHRGHAVPSSVPVGIRMRDGSGPGARPLVARPCLLTSAIAAGAPP